jgi:DNA-binding CsgD family transcriptional regulator
LTAVNPPDYQAIAEAITALDSDAFPDRLLDLADNAVGSDASMILLYWPDRPPEVVADRLVPEERPLLYGDYLAGVYRLSPFYRASLGLDVPELVRLKDIAPEGFRQSEYYRSYFAQIGVSDLLGLLLPVGQGRVVHVSLARRSDVAGFGRADITRLTRLLPVAAALTQQHWPPEGTSPRKKAPPEPQDAMRRDFNLTTRETQIADAILTGHSVKSAARLLAISAETVKVHRKNLYAKLGIASQGELFSLYLGRLNRQ